MAPITKNHESSTDHPFNRWQDAIVNALNAGRTDHRILVAGLDITILIFVIPRCSVSTFESSSMVTSTTTAPIQRQVPSYSRCQFNCSFGTIS